ncbi:MAG: hypothetical protein A3B68_08920 [Candidatus Melainabacteria bacterium RIFCSPHIGHO2_02_FULL_34_12]|nr:MAG: hypothetical protein A3B68_08920 [Candidatus Melainabacteria bacterium RIFCSPHIGHO2_02_FULL_34_12]
MITSFDKVQKAYVSDLSSNLPKLEKKASEAIKSFADLVAELNKVNKLSSGTPAKEQITRLAGELNNSSVFFAKMIGDELGKLHTMVNGDTPVIPQNPEV